MLDIAQQAALSGISAMSLGEALDRIGPLWTARLPEVARQFHGEIILAQQRFSFETVPHNPLKNSCFPHPDRVRHVWDF